MTTFFSIDVETSDTRLGYGCLLTIGMQAVVKDATTDAGWTLAPDRFYVRVTPVALPKGWHNQPDGDPVSDTHAWWLTQSAEVRAEAWADEDLVRLPPRTAAMLLTEAVTALEPDPAGRVFVANPVSFDKPWIDLLYDGAGMASPFHYRSLCLRSMRFGMRPRSAWGGDRETHDPVIPHHAYWDAEAQARDLVAMIDERDAPSLAEVADASARLGFPA